MSPPEQGYVAAMTRPLGFAPPARGAELLRQHSAQSQGNSVADAESIRTLTLAIRRGDEAAFARFYDLYSFRLYRFLLVLARGDEHEAREVCQTVLIKLAKRFAMFDDERKLWSWLCTLAKHAFIDHYRARQRQSRLVSLDELSPEPASEEKANHHLSEILRDALARLPLEERELIQAAYMDECPLQELADASGQTYKAMESRLARLRQKLKTQLLKSLRHELEP
jgi:RNA polymerase sigma-70 factor (ECF subfamily)